MWIHSLDPTILQLGPLEIRWYGLVYLLGFVLAVGWLHYARQKKLLSLSTEDIWDLVFYLLVGVLAGARLFMVFWNPEIYLAHPLNLLKIWQGGMSFHGGLVGIVLACWWYCRKKRLDFFQVADVLSVPLILALALGRIANFVNGELWGRQWNGSWCVNFKNTGGGDVCRHPSTLYAAGKRFLVFFWLLWLSLYRSFRPGFIFWNLIFWEGLGRVIVDFYRENDLFIGLSLGQWLSGIMVIAALWAFWRWYRDDWKELFSRKIIKDEGR